MDDISTEIVNSKSSSDHQNISRILIRLQDEINCQFLRQYSQSDNEKFLSQLWAFILEASSDQNTSIRLSAYRTTLTLLLKITPYYPSLIQKTFFNSIATIEIDPKTSQIVIAAFSFISNFTPIPFLNHILDIYPIFQNFTSIDSTFSDHIGPIIKNLGRIGIQNLEKLLLLYLEKGVKPQDRHLILAVTEIIKHDPPFFIGELLKYVRERSTVKENLCLISYLFSTIKLNLESFDLKDLVEISVDILSNPQNSTANDIDSALQILSLDMAPFEVSISENDIDESEYDQETDETDKNKQKLSIQITSDSYEYEFTINVSDFLVRPSFYLLPLPIDLLIISPNDGILQTTSKFKTMAKIVNKPDTRHKVKLYLYGIFSSVLSKSYNDMTSPCLQGFSLCIPTFLEMMDTTSILVLTEHVIFGPQQSWFHMNDLLNVIKFIPYKYYTFYKNQNDSNDNSVKHKFDARQVIDLLVTFSMNSNEKLSKGAEKTIAKIINYTDFVEGTYYLSEKTDFFDITSLHRFLSIFITVIQMKRKIRKKEKTIKKTDKYETLHLHYFILRLIEIRPIYDDDIYLFIQIIHFMSYFDLHFVEKQVLKEYSNSAQRILEATLFAIGCLQNDDDQISAEKLQNIYNYVSEEFSSLNFEAVPEMKMNYSNFLPSFSIALHFLFAIPRRCLLKDKKCPVLNLFGWSMYLFQRKSAQFAERFWHWNIEPKSNVDFLITVQPTIEFIQDYRTIALYCKLFLSIAKREESNENLDLFSAALHNVTRDEIDQNNFYPEFYAMEIFSNKREKDDEDPMKSKVIQLNKDQQLSLYNFLINYENDLKLIEKVSESAFDKIQDDIQKIKVEIEQKNQRKISTLEENQPEQPKEEKIEQKQDEVEQKQEEEIKTKEVKIIEDAKIVATDDKKKKKQDSPYPLPKDPKTRKKLEKQMKKELKKKNQRQEASETIATSMTFNSLQNGELPMIQDKNAKKETIKGKRINSRRSSSVEPVNKLAEKNKEESKKVARSEDENFSDDNEYGFFLYSSESYSINDESTTTAAASSISNIHALAKKYENEEEEQQTIESNEQKTIINKEYLSSNIVDQDSSNVVIKTQLKMSTFDFTQEQLEKLIRLYINNNDNNGLEKLLNYAENKRISLSLSNYLIPDDSLPTALKYLKSIDSPELNSLVDLSSNYNQTAKIKYTLFSLDPSKNFEELKNMQHITKKDIKDFTNSVDLCSHQALVDFVIKHLREAKSTKRLNYVITMANVIFSFVTVTKTEIDEIVQIVTEKEKIMPGEPLSQLVLTLASKVESNDDFVKFVKNCYSKCLGKSSGILRLHQALIASPNSKASENLSNISQPYVISTIPSVYLAGIRFIHQALSSLSESDCIPLLKANLTKLLKNFEKNRDMFPIAKVIGEPFTFILSRDSLRQFQSELINHADEIIPSNEKASFEGLSLCLPRMIDAFTDQPIDILKILESKCDRLLTEPCNISTFKIYMMSLRERVEKAIKNRSKDDIVSDFITQWMQECKRYDCYYMAEIIYEWENLIFQFYGLEQLLNYACYQFFKYIPRFFPLYIGLSRFIRKNYKAASDEDKEMIRQYLQNSALINPVRAHSLSTLLVTEIEFSKEALELAAYPEDCEESNKLIDSNPHFVDLLNKIKSNV